MYRERIRTRDLLLEYDTNIMPSVPRVAGLNMIYNWGSTPLKDENGNAIPVNPNGDKVRVIYPWENSSLTILSQQFYQIAIMNGFVGTEREFFEKFNSFISDKQIIFAQYSEFPDIGSYSKLYFDLDENILYYWDNDYIPVNAMLIANTTIYGGGA